MVLPLPETTIKDWLVETLPYEVMWLTAEGDIAYANQLCRERLGYSEQSLKKRPYKEINPFLTDEAWRGYWEQSKKRGTYYFKSTHQSADGNFYDIEVCAQHFLNEDEELLCLIIQNITYSYFYHNMMTRTEKMAGIGSWKLNFEDDSFLVTDEALTIFDCTQKEELLPENLALRFHEGQEYLQALETLQMNGRPLEMLLQTKETPSRYIKVMVEAKVKDNYVHKIIGAYQDVTELHQTVNDLEYYKEVIEQAQDLILVFNMVTGTLLHCNDSALAAFGHGREVVKDMHIHDFDPTTKPDWWEKHVDVLYGKGTAHYEWLATHRNGTRFPVEVTSTYLRYNGIDMDCMVMRDITERKARELELYEALAEIEELKDQLEQENAYLQEEVKRSINFGNIISVSATYAPVLTKINQVAPTEATVLITGESGTGKELLANAIHQHSSRASHPLIKINCATLPKELIESELFGHKKGAFTGAMADKLGKFALADKGTIFLDEIGEMPVDLQAKLLRVLQEGEFDPLGSHKSVKVNVRVIAATNRDLEALIQDGTFREDLFYRLNVFPIHNLPLRERREDIPVLANHFLEKHATRVGKQFTRLSTKTVDLLMKYPFPGNIRELENLIERAVIVELGPTLKPGDWLPKPKMEPIPSGFATFEEIQRDHIIQVLQHTGWRVSGPKGAAHILGLNSKTLFAKMKKLGIEKEIRVRVTD
ncbi:MAG TPA: hypothetical protein DCE41_23600 [Cytophagales bacterium]|nr:hypothetical protein [Cytophagales bacterium]HAP64047.1 hypothetical protein [Cytophagales bacterium]